MSTPLPKFGLALRESRRARKLSQLDLANGADISQRHLSFLESGRSRPSRVMVLQLSEAMGLPLRDRNRLLLCAGFAPIFPERRLDSPDMAPVRQALNHLLQHHEPYPALIVDRRWNLIQSNRAGHGLLGLTGDAESLWQRACGDGQKNIMQLLLHPDGLRPFLRNIEEIAPAMILRLQREALEDSRVAEILHQILGLPNLPKRWTQGELGSLPLPLLPICLQANGARLNLFTMISTFGTPQDLTTDELRVETMFPMDAGSESLLRSMAAADQAQKAA
ncbi:MAG: helix-turn-helix domain-containing protein [Panacagrimonas sp.]